MGAGRLGRPRALHAAGKVCGDGVDVDDAGVATGVCRASFGWCSTFGDADALVATIAEHFAEEERVATSHASGSSTEREAPTATVASVCVYPLKSAAAFSPKRLAAAAFSKWLRATCAARVAHAAAAGRSPYSASPSSSYVSR